MKNTVKLFDAMRGIAIITLMALIGFTACDTGNGPETSDITWTAVADGTANTTTSTKITFTFSAAVTGLEADDITLTGGTGVVTKGTLSGSDKSWELGITVTTAGTVSVKVTKNGISSAAKNITVYKSASSDITWTLAQVGGVPGAGSAAPTASTTAITITFSGAVSLTDTDITIGGAASRDSSSQLSSSGNVWTVPVTVEHTDNATVTVTKNGVESGQKTVMVYKQGEVPPITWEAVADGAASTTSTKITFTFSSAVTDLTANDITLTGGGGGGGAATKGSLTGSGTSWELGITVETAGTVSVKITKDGVSATVQDVTVYKAGGVTPSANPISGRTTYINLNYADYQLVFSTISGNSGTYTLETQGDSEWDQLYGEGSYTWDENAGTVTLTMTQVADDDGEMVNRTQAEPIKRAFVQEQADSEIEYNKEYGGEDYSGMDEEDAIALFLEYWNEQLGTNYTTVEEYVDGETARMLSEIFDPRPYTYVLVNNDETLILLEALPAPVGSSDELAGQTYYGTYTDYDWETGEAELVKDEDSPYSFSATGRTFTSTVSDYMGGTIPITGSYSYNATTKRVYLKLATIDGKTPEQYYADVDDYSQWSNFPDEVAHCVAKTSQRFKLMTYGYDVSEKFIIELLY
jgi:hypothetical protein